MNMMPVDRLRLALDADVLAALGSDSLETPGILEAAIAAGDQEVREAIALGEFQQPSELSAFLTELVITLAVSRLFDRKRELLSPPWDERARGARAMLREIAAGTRLVPSLVRARGRIVTNHDHQEPHPVYTVAAAKGGPLS